MNPFRTFCLLSVLLLTGTLSSCMMPYRYTSIDLGAAIDNFGRQNAYVRDELCPEEQAGNGRPRYETRYRVWKKDGLYYVLLPLAYLPANDTVFSHCCSYHTRRQTLACRWPEGYPNEADILAAPVEYYVGILTPAQYADACRWRKFYTRWDCRLGAESHEVVPLEEVNLADAELILDAHPATVFGPRPQLSRVANQAPIRRTWYNQCLRPVGWVAEVVDIPLTLIATPIGWLVDAVYEPLKN